MDIIETVRVYEEGKVVSLEFDASGMNKLDTYTFSDLGFKTKISSTHYIKGDGIMTRAMYFLMKRLFVNTDKGHQAKFKEIVEERF